MAYDNIKLGARNPSNHPILLQNRILDDMKSFYGENKKDLPAALAVYIFLYYSVRWQKNVRPKVNNVFIRNGIGLSDEKVRRAKKDLVEMKLIEIVQPTKENGQFQKEIIKVRHVWHETRVQKLFIEAGRVNEYKLAKALLMQNYDDGEMIDSSADCSVELEIRGHVDEYCPSCFYFENGYLKCTIELSNGEVNCTVPTKQVGDIIVSLAKKEQYSFQMFLDSIEKSA